MAQQERRGLRRMILLLEDLCDIGEKAAWEAIQALHAYYTTGTLPDDLRGDAKLFAVAVIERERREGR